MGERIGGNRPRPKVAILGDFDSNVVDKFHLMFPTIWEASGNVSLMGMVSVKDLDLLIISPNATIEYPIHWQTWRDYLHNLNIISFSPHITLPGPLDELEVTISKADTEQFFLPDLPISLNRQRENDFHSVEHIRGWNTIVPEDNYVHNVIDEAKNQERLEKSINKLWEGAVVQVCVTKEPLATIYKRPSGFFVAWFPNSAFDPLNWVELICMDWSDKYPEIFPNFGNWQKSSEWMTQTELDLASEIESLETRRLEVNREIDAKIADLNLQQVEATLVANQGRRRLITSQGRELVEEVAGVFKEFGFGVQIKDDDIDPTKPKREDLRLTIPENPEWEAIVEVRGYARSSGQTQDFQRIARFAMMYLKEKGKLPDQRIYVVNGEFEIAQPSRRQQPFAAAKEDLEAFAEDDGLVIWSLDLFRQAKRLGEVSAEELLRSIVDSRGRWQGL